jgi:hypothetical protein
MARNCACSLSVNVTTNFLAMAPSCFWSTIQETNLAIKIVVVNY